MQHSLYQHVVTGVAGLPLFELSGLQNKTAYLGTSPPALPHRRRLRSCCSLSPSEPSPFSRNSDETQGCRYCCRYTNMTAYFKLSFGKNKLTVCCFQVIILAYRYFIQQLLLITSNRHRYCTHILYAVI